MAYQWVDVLEGHPPSSLTDLPCDHWVVGDGPELGTKALLCIDCGWYRIIPNGDEKAAQALRATINAVVGIDEMNDG
jgi:hypothetical protein